MLKRLLNCGERITHHRLSEVCGRRSAQVFAKVRLADVLPIERSGLSDGLYQFALQAHYDFVITDLAHKPLFALELDGPGHVDPIQVERDAKKNGLSHRFGLPLLRILSDDLNRSEWQIDRLTEVTERWFDERQSESCDRAAAVNGPMVTPLAGGDDVADGPMCPLCGASMVAKYGKYGPFLSCARYPECRGSVDLPQPSPSRPRSGIVNEATANTSPRRWLIAGVVLVGLALVSLLVVIARPSTDRVPAGESAPKDAETSPATVRQMNLLSLLISRRGWDTAERDAEIGRVLGHMRRYSNLSKQEASKLITAWDARGK